MARKLQFPEVFQVRFQAGTLAAIDAALAADETRQDMAREALQREIQRRKDDILWEGIKSDA